MYKRVKRGTMILAGIQREILAELTSGRIGDDGRSKKEFLTTEHGRFRLCSGTNSDNTTETAAHDRMHADTVVMEGESLKAFFELHGLLPGPTLVYFLAETRKRLEEALG